MSGSSSRPSPLSPTLSATAEAAAGARFTPGDLVAGRYEVQSALGRGGMGEVYRVRDRELDEVVALKMLHRDLIGSAEMLSRFRSEVKLARRVTHKNVARTFDIGEHEGERFLTMELVEGETLGEVLVREGKLAVPRALELARGIAAGLAAAHDAAVIHRDLKPENVVVGSGGRVVVMDFGIARASAFEGPGLTGGGAMGTPAYMAPEQVEGVEVLDARVDVYAFGTVLYEMLTGKLAWSGTSPYLVATARLTSPPPDPRAVRAELAPALATFVLRCMARDRSERFADGRALLAAIDELASARADVDAFERRSGADGLADDIARQLVLMDGRSAVHHRVLEEVLDLLRSAHGGEVAALFERAWQKRSFEGPYERPLLVLGALRADARAEGPTHPLFAAVAADRPDPAAVTPEAVRASLARERLGYWITVRTRRVQTNETTRAIAWLWPATLAQSGDRRRPLALFDIGASAGLNLTAERLPRAWTRSTGEPIPIAHDLDIRSRVGFDPRPLDVKNTDDRAWLEACIWPEQRDRLARLEAAIAAFRSASPTPELVLLRASSVPGRLEAASTVASGSLAIAYQTLVRGYIPEEERLVYESGMRGWLEAGASGERIWATLELEEIGRPDVSCAIDVHVGVGGSVEVVRLGRTSYHPSSVEVELGAEARLAELLG